MRLRRVFQWLPVGAASTALLVGLAPPPVAQAADVVTPTGAGQPVTVMVPAQEGTTVTIRVGSSLPITVPVQQKPILVPPAVAPVTTTPAPVATVTVPPQTPPPTPPTPPATSDQASDQAPSDPSSPAPSSTPAATHSQSPPSPTDATTAPDSEPEATQQPEQPPAGPSATPEQPRSSATTAPVQTPSQTPGQGSPSTPGGSVGTPLTTPQRLPTVSPTWTPTSQSTQQAPAQTPASSGTPQSTGPAPSPSTTTQSTQSTQATQSTESTSPEDQGGAQSVPAPVQGPVASRLPAGGAHASGLPWLNGVFGHDVARTKRFEEKLGRPVDIVGVSPERSGGWGSIFDTWWMSKTPRDGVILDVSVPLFPNDSSLENAAAGGDNAQWQKLGALIQSKYPGSAVRIGWEMNIGGWPWRATEENAEQWKKAFRNASTSLKEGGPTLLVQWNPNAGKGDSLADATKVYPGDDVVDIVALDSYDWWPGYNEKTWPQHRDGEGGWAFWVKFARDHGKRFSVPEWGLAPGNDNSGGDNPFYMNVVSDFLWENRDIVFSVVYFDETQDYIRSSIADGMVPKGAAAYKAKLDAFAAQTSQGAAAGGLTATRSPGPAGQSSATASPAPTNSSSGSSPSTAIPDASPSQSTTSSGSPENTPENSSENSTESSSDRAKPALPR